MRVALQLGMLTRSRTYVLANADSGTLPLADYSYSAASIMFLARAELSTSSAPSSSTSASAVASAHGSTFQHEVAARMQAHDWATRAGHRVDQKLDDVPLLSESGSSSSPQIPVWYTSATNTLELINDLMFVCTFYINICKLIPGQSGRNLRRGLHGGARDRRGHREAGGSIVRARRVLVSRQLALRQPEHCPRLWLI